MEQEKVIGSKTLNLMTSKTKTTVKVRQMALEFTKIVIRDASKHPMEYRENQIKCTTEIMETILNTFPEPDVFPSINDVLESMLSDIESLDRSSKHLILQVHEDQSCGVAEFLIKHHELMNALKHQREQLISLLNSK